MNIDVESVKAMIARILSPESIAQYLVQLVENMNDPRYQDSWKKIAEIIVLAKEYDPFFPEKALKALRKIQVMLEEVKEE